MAILVTGGAGFIGSNFVRSWCAHSGELLVNLDKLTYSGNLGNLRDLAQVATQLFVKGDIGDADLLEHLFREYRFRAVVHFAAESHVDRSIHGPAEFVDTNIVGTFRLLEAARAHCANLAGAEREGFRFLHVSTDEVFGSLDPEDAAFTETSRYAPNSPYSASKAASDHLVRAYHHTYGLPTLTTHCSNNYGPFQFPEKLIPLCIHNALGGRPLPVYGDGRQVRDWLYVDDHCRALTRVLDSGQPGATYNIGGCNEKANIDVVHLLCALLDEMKPRDDGHPYAEQIAFVKDRPGHDRRYAIDALKMEAELGWAPQETFESGLRKTVAWYLAHTDWVASVASGAYRQWIDLQYQ